MITDDHIVEGCLAGKRKAYSLLYRKYAPVMLGLCLRYGKNLQDAEDILQEGFIKVFRNITGFRREGSFEGWIRKIMIRSAIDHYHKELRHAYHEALDDNTEVPDEYADDISDTDFEVTPEQLIGMIQELPEGYRIVFSLYVMENYSHKEIAGELNISENTSKTQLLKARRMLRNRLIVLAGKQNLTTVSK